MMIKIFSSRNRKNANKTRMIQSEMPTKNSPMIKIKIVIFYQSSIPTMTALQTSSRIFTRTLIRKTNVNLSKIFNVTICIQPNLDDQYENQYYDQQKIGSIPEPQKQHLSPLPFQDQQKKLPQSQQFTEVPQTKNNIQLTLDYKLSKKWKQKIDKFVLQQKSIGQFSAKHNRNMAKFFIRLFSKYAKNTTQTKQQELELTQRVQEIAQKKCISLKDLEEIFGGQSAARRQFMAGILNKRLTQQIIKSQDVKNKYAYLLCSKVYALRCRSRHLVGRLQSR